MANKGRKALSVLSAGIIGGMAHRSASVASALIAAGKIEHRGSKKTGGYFCTR